MVKFYVAPRVTPPFYYKGFVAFERLFISNFDVVRQGFCNEIAYFDNSSHRSSLHDDIYRVMQRADVIYREHFGPQRHRELLKPLEHRSAKHVAVIVAVVVHKFFGVVYRILHHVHGGA